MGVKVRTVLKPGCAICKRCACWYDKLQICHNTNSVRITRHLSKLMDSFIILEDYRCMPLLGDEDEVPNWDVHIVKYTVVYIHKTEERFFNINI